MKRESNAWWLTLLTVALIVTGMAYSLWWPALVRHTPGYWVYPFDLFGTVEVSRWTEAGALGYIYSSHSGVVTLPGFAILFTPVVTLSQALHLSSTSVAFPVPRPSQWLLVGPVSMATSLVALAGLDSLASSLGLSMTRRRLMLLAEAGAIWPVVAWWGHPEDVVALGLCAFALRRAFQGRLASAGWFLGGAVAMQLYVLLLIPIFVGYLGLRRLLPFVVPSFVVPTAILLAVLIPDPHQTLHILLDQPTQPHVDHPTPWLLAAPHIGPDEVAGGPGRVVGLLAACGLGMASARRRGDPLAVVWLAAIALAIRCLTEAVMAPYYVAPFIALALLSVAFHSWQRCALVVAASAALMVLTFRRPDMWLYWVQMAAPIGVLVLASRQPRSPSVDKPSADPDGLPIRTFGAQGAVGSMQGTAVASRASVITRLPLASYRTISIRRPTASHSGSSGRRDIARARILRAVHMQAAASTS